MKLKVILPLTFPSAPFLSIQNACSREGKTKAVRYICIWHHFLIKKFAFAQYAFAFAHIHNKVVQFIRRNLSHTGYTSTLLI